MPDYAGVVIEDTPLSTIYHYRIPEKLSGRVEPGVRVSVPFGHRKAHGYVVSLSDTAPIEESRIKDLSSVSKGGTLATPEVLELTRWIAGYYHCGWGAAIAAAVPVGVRKGTKKKTLLHVGLEASLEEAAAEIEKRSKRAPQQAAALSALLTTGKTMSYAELQELSGASRIAVKALERDKLVTLTTLPLHRELAVISEPPKEITLTKGQEQALAAALATLKKQEFAVHLLHGATASGKTEVYLRALEYCLAQKRTALVLVPEIGLTPQAVERFRRRVGEVAVLHSRMSAGERALEWRRLRSGEVRVAIGARSAIFSPVPHLGLIVVDEEHDRSFKQDSTPRYHARDVAVVRARQCGATVLLGSATPSLESYYNAQHGKYTLQELPERVSGGTLPATEIIDMRQEWLDLKKQVIVSRRLEREIADRLHRKEQVILFLNRRGFNTWVHCLHCGAAITCPNCDISLTYHQRRQELRCHYCEYTEAVPTVCPDCSAPQLRFAGSGTEKAEEVIANLFPSARLLRMDTDTMSGRDSHAAALSAFARGEFDILLGTQMVAKGHDFPNVTLIGVLFADGSINLPDFRAAESTFQLVTQVVGRSGRGKRPGLGIVQAYDPRHYAVQLAAKQDYHAFVEKEMADREAYGYPPFGRLARILVRGENRHVCERLIADAAHALRAAAPRRAVLGPVSCPIAKIQKNYRYHLLLKARTPREINRILHEAKEFLKDKGATKLIIDIDPVSLL